ALLDNIIRQRLARADRRIALPQRLLQPRREGRSKARGNLVTRARGDVTDGFQPGATQSATDRFIGAERKYRQWTDGICFLAIGNDHAMYMTVHGPRADRRRGDRRAYAKTLRSQRIA